MLKTALSKEDDCEIKMENEYVRVTILSHNKEEESDWWLPEVYVKSEFNPANLE